MANNTMCRIPVTGCMIKNPVTGEWELDEDRSTWADIPADAIARVLIQGFGLDAITKGAGAE